MFLVIDDVTRLLAKFNQPYNFKDFIPIISPIKFHIFFLTTDSFNQLIIDPM